MLNSWVPRETARCGGRRRFKTVPCRHTTDYYYHYYCIHYCTMIIIWKDGMAVALYYYYIIYTCVCCRRVATIVEITLCGDPVVACIVYARQMPSSDVFVKDPIIYYQHICARDIVDKGDGKCMYMSKRERKRHDDDIIMYTR